MPLDDVQKRKKELMLISLSRHFYKDGAQSLVNKIVESDEPLTIPPHIDDPKTPLNFNKQFVMQIHYSWIAEALSSYPLIVQDSVLLTIDTKQGKKACKLMGRSYPKKKENQIIKNFGTEQLVNTFELRGRIPIPYLPDSPLNSLLGWKKQDLVTLIDLLPMHQIAPEIKKIVDRNKLMGIYSALNQIQQKYLKVCMHHKKSTSSHELDLPSWDGGEKKLISMLHKSGLRHFSLSLSGQDEDFMWYLTRLLDIGRGKWLLDHKEEDQAKKEAIYLNLCHAMKFLTSTHQ